MLALLAAAIGLQKSPLLAKDPNYFPIAVWLQTPSNAVRYKAIGINLYIGLWEGPTEEQISALEMAKMPVICQFNDRAKAHLDRRQIVGWMHEDEPDNAQEIPGGKGYGPPIATEKIVADYKAMRAADPSRPVVLNLGQGVAWDDWYGRGVRTHHPEDYAAYVKGADIASFDIYPVTSPPPVQGKLEYVGNGTRRLKDWCVNGQPVWACIEATHIGNADVKPTPEQVRSLVWMAIIHGARGLVYFSHQFKPSFIEAGILADPGMCEGIRQINAQVQALAPAINSASAKPTVSVAKPPAGVTIIATINVLPSVDVDILEKQSNGQHYLFAVSMKRDPQFARFLLRAKTKNPKITVIGENRTVTPANGSFSDDFAGYGVHLYSWREGS